MSYPLNYPTPQNANVQVLYRTGTWVKPQGASFVWFTLIGAGGGGGTSNSTNTYYGSGGGSGAVTNFMGPAFLIPDELLVSVGSGGKGSIGYDSGSYSGAGAGGATSIIYQEKDGTGYTLLTANGGGGGNRGGSSSDANASSGGAATAANFFSAMGFYQSIAGQASTTSTTSQTPSATTFLSGGTANSCTANYGYSNSGSQLSKPGYFLLQPIIVGVAGGRYDEGVGGIGCGGACNYSTGNGGRGGDGLAVIITW